MALVVVACVPTPGDGRPDCYFLTNVSHTAFFEFVPHFGLRRANLEEAAERVAAYRRHIEEIAAQAISKAEKASAINGRFEALFAQVAA